MSASAVAAPSVASIIDSKCKDPSQPAGRSNLGGRLAGLTCAEAVRLDAQADHHLDLGDAHLEASRHGQRLPGGERGFAACGAQLRYEAYYIAAKAASSGHPNPGALYNQIFTQGRSQTVYERSHGETGYCWLN